MSTQREADEAALKAAIGYDPVPLSIRNHPEITFEYRTAKDRDGLIERILAAGFTRQSGGHPRLRARLDSLFRTLTDDGDMTPSAVRQIERVLDAEGEVKQSMQPPTRKEIAATLDTWWEGTDPDGVMAEDVEALKADLLALFPQPGPSAERHTHDMGDPDVWHVTRCKTCGMAASIEFMREQCRYPAEPVSIADMVPGTTPVVCICGSTRFRDEMTNANRRLTLGGSIVVAPGVFGHSGDTMTDEQKTALDALHFQKIDLAQSIYVVNPGGYIGESTTREIAYAERTGKPVVYLVDPSTIRDVTPPS